jgi:hypothetical protein
MGYVVLNHESEWDTEHCDCSGNTKEAGWEIVFS